MKMSENYLNLNQTYKYKYTNILGRNGLKHNDFIYKIKS